MQNDIKNHTKHLEKYCSGGSKIEENRGLEGSWTPPVIMLVLKRHLGGILGSSWQHLGAILGPSWAPESKKCEQKPMLKMIFFLNRFFFDFERIWVPKWLPNPSKIKKKRRQKYVAKVNDFVNRNLKVFNRFGT